VISSFLKRTAAVIGVAGLLALSAGPVAAQDEARVRVLHASPDAPAVDVYLDDAMVDALTDVPFGTLSDYLPIPAGTYNVKVYATGTTTDPVLDFDAPVEAGMSYTIAAINPVASIDRAIFADNPSLDDTKALVRVVHLSPDAPAVDIAPDGADAVIPNLAFPDATDYLPLEPNTYDLEVRVAGSDAVALQLDPLEIKGGRAYSVFAIGSAAMEPLGGNALTVIVALDAMTMPDTATIDEPAAGGFSLTTAALLVAAVAAALLSLGFAGRAVVARQSR
jgi:hypothetical protein